MPINRLEPIQIEMEECLASVQLIDNTYKEARLVREELRREMRRLINKAYALGLKEATDDTP